MTANSIAISRNLVSAGMERKAADAVAEEMVTHSGENFSTKEDTARIEGSLGKVEDRVGKVEGTVLLVAERGKLLLGMQVGLIVLFIADKFIK